VWLLAKKINLKVTKYCLQASVDEKRLTGMSVLSVDHKVVNTIHIDALSDKVASLKARELPS
jgi:hypothetical protein